MAKDDARTIRALLQDRLSELLGKLLPGGRINGGLYVVKNPTRDDQKPGSFVIWMNGNAKGGFKDYAGGDADKGDVIDLINYVHRRPKSDKKFALDWARDFLGLATMDPRARKAAEEAARAKAQQAAKRESDDALLKKIRIAKMFNTALPIEDTIAMRYFEARECPLQLVPYREDDLRFAPSLEWWSGAEWETMPDGRRRKLRPGPEYPAIVAAVRNYLDDIVAVHCTFLREDGSGKAPVDNPKLMYGPVAGGVVRLTRGPQNLTPAQASLAGRSDILAISEGIETGLSVAIGAPEARVWAATSLSNIANVPVWHACVSSVVIAADNVSPTASAQGRIQFQEQMDRAIEAISAHDVPCVVMQPHHGSDFNDLIRGG